MGCDYIAIMENAPVSEVSGVLEAADRRRPGRRGDAKPELVGLLRGSGGAEFLAPGEDDDTIQLSAARGVVVAVLLSAVFWVVAAATIFLL